MRIKILCFGKLAKEFDPLFNFYAKKINKRVSLEVIELKEVFSSDLSSNQTKNEFEILTKLEKLQDYETFLFDSTGVGVTSEDFAEIILKNQDFKNASLLFIIGPSDGFSQAFKTRFSSLSFGKITYPHQLFRIVVAEQIYRGIKINYHETYHK